MQTICVLKVRLHGMQVPSVIMIQMVVKTAAKIRMTTMTAFSMQTTRVPKAILVGLQAAQRMLMLMAAGILLKMQTGEEDPPEETTQETHREGVGMTQPTQLLLVIQFGACTTSTIPSHRTTQSIVNLST